MDRIVEIEILELLSKEDEGMPDLRKISDNPTAKNAHFLMQRKKTLWHGKFAYAMLQRKPLDRSMHIGSVVSRIEVANSWEVTHQMESQNLEHSCYGTDGSLKI